MIVAVPIFSLTIAAMLFIRYRRVQQEITQLIQRLRDTALYRRLYPLLMCSANHGLEEVYVFPGGICFRTITPTPRTRWFIFAQEGFDDLTADTVSILIQAMAVDVACLGQRSLYVLEQGEERTGEEKYTWYAYRLYPHCKDRCLQYYRIKEQSIRSRM